MDENEESIEENEELIEYPNKLDVSNKRELVEKLRKEYFEQQELKL